jgi:hypothetical protein
MGEGEGNRLLVGFDGNVAAEIIAKQRSLGIATPTGCLPSLPILLIRHVWLQAPHPWVSAFQRNPDTNHTLASDLLAGYGMANRCGTAFAKACGT